jgi:hypothetical protein
VDAIADPQGFPFLPSIGDGQVVGENSPQKSSVQEKIGLQVFVENPFCRLGGDGPVEKKLLANGSQGDSGIRKLCLAGSG